MPAALTWRERRRRTTNVVMLALCGVAAVLTVVPLLLIFFYLVREGVSAIDLDFFTETPAPVGETGGGIGNAVLGTVLMVGGGGAMGLPIAIGAGIFLAESETRVADTVRFVTDVMNGIPSIVTGIFVWAWVVLAMGHFSAFAGAVALAVMLIPMVTRTTEEMIRLVPPELRDGGLALGLARWRTTVGIVLPAARSGILTGVLVGLARIAGETAPLLFTALGNDYWEWRPGSPMAALPLQIYKYATSPFPEWHRQAWAASLVLLGLVLLVSLTARFVIRSPYHQSS
ncbi:MAG: phosphate ABC transporter permease PstA [Longimicrobiaceae bacterium]